jgi:hypothetical protein
MWINFAPMLTDTRASHPDDRHCVTLLTCSSIIKSLSLCSCLTIKHTRCCEAKRRRFYKKQPWTELNTISWHKTRAGFCMATACLESSLELDNTGQTDVEAVDQPWIRMCVIGFRFIKPFCSQPNDMQEQGALETKPHFNKEIWGK